MEYLKMITNWLCVPWRDNHVCLFVCVILSFLYGALSNSFCFIILQWLNATLKLLRADCVTFTVESLIALQSSLTVYYKIMAGEKFVQFSEQIANILHSQSS